MSKHIKVEKMKPEDAQEMAEWMSKLSHRNNIDPDIFTYPATETLKASNGKALVYMPIQSTFFLESLAINPDASPLEVAASLKALFQVVEFEAECKGHGELYFLCADKETCEFAEHQGMQKIETLTLYRRKL